MSSKYSLFDVYGIEAEYMIVDQKSLKIKTISDTLLTDLNDGELTDDIELDDVSLSNELVRHVIELKCTEPHNDLLKMEKDFHTTTQLINKSLKKHNAVLLPTGMHPWMQPNLETELWPHGNKDIYKKYNEIFNCQGHGWSNLQSVHINLPFADDAEFGKLHAAVRVVLPFVPFMAASSPYFEGGATKKADNRLAFYEQNQKKIPMITGKVIPEAIFTLKDYQKMLNDIYKEVKPYDPEGIIQHQWVNSRGAITKLDLNAIEIRVMDIQECPYMDFSLIALFTEIVKHLVADKKLNEKCKELDTMELKAIYDESLGLNDFQVTEKFAALFSTKKKLSMNALLEEIFTQLSPKIPAHFHQGIKLILKQGNLAKRLLKHHKKPELGQYEKLKTCLDKNIAYE
ncbi:MAG: hypothetical protein JNM93_02060 [Bacteriovoracaceae bacterium]|nr:hypothetical protein [Bacteriovoracaceae bacterium]